MSTRIGCDNLVYAIMTTEETLSASPVYGPVVSAPGVMSLNINPNGSQETLFADDGPMEVASTLGRIEVEIQKNELTAQNKADLLGHAIDINGAVVFGDSDVPPWVAIGFRTLKSSGKYRYVWLYKGRFNEPEDQNETKGDGINFQADTINGQFTRLSKKFTIGTGSNAKDARPWKYELDEETASASTSVIAAWFNAPVMPNSTPVNAPALAATFAAGTETGTTTATISTTCGDGNHWAYKVTSTVVSTPVVGAVVTGTTEYTSGNDISGVDATTNKYLNLYELNGSGAVVKFLEHTVISTEIA